MWTGRLVAEMSKLGDPVQILEDMVIRAPLCKGLVAHASRRSGVSSPWRSEEYPAAPILLLCLYTPGP